MACSRSDSHKLKIIPAEGAEDIGRIRGLFREYTDALGFDLGFQDYEKELASLPGDYGPPGGHLLLAFWEGELAGCAGLRKIENGICEMKRMYVKPAYRGKGIGRALAQKLVDYARQAGYQKMRLDTIDTMNEAIALYRSLGFREIPAYRLNPIRGAKYMEIAL